MTVEVINNHSASASGRYECARRRSDETRKQVCGTACCALLSRSSQVFAWLPR